MMDELIKPKPDIEIVNHAGIGVYNANKEAMNRIKALSDKDFEKEISQFPEDTQMFMRLAGSINAMAESLYNDISQRYFAIQNKLYKLRMEQNSIARQIGQYEEELDELDSVLCKYGKHVYEGFRIEDNKDG